MIKEVNIEDTPFNNKGAKFNQFYSDLKEIIEKKIKYCEFVDFPYADSTSIQDLNYRARKYLHRYVFEEIKLKGEILPRFDSIRDKLFVFTKEVVNGQTKFYAKFDVDEWEKIVKEE